MKALQRIIKDRDHLMREVNEVIEKIQTYKQTIETLENSILTHSELIHQYNQIIELVQKED